MSQSKRTVALIPARGGSKSIPYKNIRSFVGKPLLAWSIEVANATPELTDVFVTTDDERIAAVAREYGAGVLPRPAELATDTSLVIDAIKHHVNQFYLEGFVPDALVLLEPTAPLRLPEDVSACVRKLLSDSDPLDSVATFTEADLNPHRAWRIVDKTPVPFLEGSIPWLPRQALPNAYQLNGGVYAFTPKFILQQVRAVFGGKCGAVLMPRDRSIDIDDELQFNLAESLLKKRMQNHGSAI